LPGRLQNVEFPCQYQSFRRILWKAASDSTTTASLKNCPCGCGKEIQNLYPGPDHHQKLISSSDW